MTKEQLQHKAYQTYAAIGELSVKRKQILQTLSQVEEKLHALEQEIVNLSTTTPSPTNKEVE